MTTELVMVACTILIFAGLYMVTSELHLIGSVIYHATRDKEDGDET